MRSGASGFSGTADAMVAGARDMTFSALLVGVARGIFVVLDEGHIVDSLVHAIVTPIEGLPVTLSALAMFFAQALIHIPVPSTSGQAVLTMPILAPVSDLIGLSRQVTVLAYQLGNGTFDLALPHQRCRCWHCSPWPACDSTTGSSGRCPAA